MAIRRKNLIALIFAPNNYYTRVVSIDDPEVIKDKITINLRAGTWRRHSKTHYKTYSIGTARYVRFGYGVNGVIGVYDRTDLGHLNSMVHDVKEATTELRCDN